MDNHGLKIYGILQELKDYGWKTCFCGQPAEPRGHSIPVLNERNVSDGGNLCSLRLVILKSV